jgi:hypothetical protein
MLACNFAQSARQNVFQPLRAKRRQQILVEVVADLFQRRSAATRVSLELIPTFGNSLERIEPGFTFLVLIFPLLGTGVDVVPRQSAALGGLFVSLLQGH